MNDDTAYYTVDTTRVPASTIWRAAVRASPVLSPLLFAIVFARKLLRSRFRAPHAVRRPESLPTVTADTVPPEVHHEFVPYIRACEDAGFRLMFYAMPEYIGNKRGCSAVLLDPTGTVIATVVWSLVWVGSKRESNVAFSCHSRLQCGTLLETGPVADERWPREPTLPNYQQMCLPMDTPAHDVVAAHIRRISEHQGELSQFDHASLGDHMLQMAQEVFDHMIEEGYYVRLTPAEVRRLSG